MAKELIKNVTAYVKSGDHAGVHRFKAGETLPSWAESAVTNDQVFAGSGAVGVEASPDSDSDESGSFSSMKKAELKAEASARGLSTAGTVADLVARLEADL